MAKLSERILFFLLAIVVLCWGAYHFYNYYNDPLQFETVFEYTVPRTLAGTGIAIRQERLIEDAPTGVESYLHDDATRVAIGEVVAEYYRDSAGDRNIRRIRELEREIEMLEAAQDTNINNLSNADAINREIRDKLGSMAWIAATGSCRELTATRDSLASLVNRRQIAIGQAENYAPRIAALQEELSSLAVTSGQGGVATARAPAAGFFSKHCDGYEGLIDTSSMSGKSIDEIRALIERDPPQTPSGQVGRLITHQTWYFAMPLPVHQSEWLKKGQNVELYFEQAGDRFPAVVHDLKYENNSDEVVAFFRCSYLSAEIINLRVSEATVYAARHSGLRISTSSLYFRKNPRGEIERGVYVLAGNTIQFRLVYPVYEEASFLLSDMNPAVPPTPVDEGEPGGEEYKTPAAVKRYDLVVTGVDLYDGKPAR